MFSFFFWANESPAGIRGLWRGLLIRIAHLPSLANLHHDGCQDMLLASCFCKAVGSDELDERLKLTMRIEPLLLHCRSADTL